MTNKELEIILENHKHWLAEDVDGWLGMRADLYEANLYRADLCGAKNIPFIYQICPDKGSFIGYKKHQE